MSFSPSHPIPDADYLLSRATAEAEAAERAVQSQSAEAHQRLASLYLDRLFGPDQAAAEKKAPTRSRVREARATAMAALRRLKPVGDASDFTDLLVRLP